MLFVRRKLYVSCCTLQAETVNGTDLSTIEMGLYVDWFSSDCEGKFFWCYAGRRNVDQTGNKQ